MTEQGCVVGQYIISVRRIRATNRWRVIVEGIGPSWRTSGLIASEGHAAYQRAIQWALAEGPWAP